MARGYFIREGDKTSCGGVVLAGDGRTTMMGFNHAREGDPVTCGINGQAYEIVGGIGFIDSNGRSPAGTLDSISSCPCRSQLLNSLNHSYEKANKPTARAPDRASTQSQSREESRPASAPQVIDPVPTPSTSPKTCNHPDRMEELAAYIADEMNRNISHPSVLEMKELNSYDAAAETREHMALPFYKRLGAQPDFHTFALAKQAKAFALWTERVGQNRPWDHKPMIKSKFDGAWQKQGAHDYYHDIWSNIHYGYVGTIGGLSESVLLDGAGAEQIVSDTVRKAEEMRTKPKEEWRHPGPHPTASPWTELRSWDDVADRVSISIGIELAARYPRGGITADEILKEVLALAPQSWGAGIRIHECN